MCKGDTKCKKCSIAGLSFNKSKSKKVARKKNIDKVLFKVGTTAAGSGTGVVLGNQVKKFVPDTTQNASTKKTVLSVLLQAGLGFMGMRSKSQFMKNAGVGMAISAIAETGAAIYNKYKKPEAPNPTNELFNISGIGNTSFSEAAQRAARAYDTIRGESNTDTSFVLNG